MPRFARGLRSPSSLCCRHFSSFSFVFVYLCRLFPATFPIASLGCPVKSGQSSERWDRALDFFFRFPGCCDVARPPRHFSMPDVLFSPSVFLSVCSVDGPAAVAPASGSTSRSSPTPRSVMEPVCDPRGLVRSRHLRHCRRGRLPAANFDVVVFRRYNKDMLIHVFSLFRPQHRFLVCSVFLDITSGAS